MNRFKLSKAGVSANEGIERFNGDKDLYEEFLNNFVNDTCYAQLVEAINSGKVDQAFSAAHSLKGVAGNLALTRLYEHIVPLVEELRGGSLAQAPELLKPVEEDYRAIMDVLKP